MSIEEVVGRAVMLGQTIEIEFLDVNEEEMKERFKTFLIVVIAIIALGGCTKTSSNAKLDNIGDKTIEFWGDSSTVFIAKNIQNGYHVSIINNRSICLYHFERGDSISRYCLIHEVPFECRHYIDSIGVYSVDMEFPVLKLDTLNGSNPSMFFMDVNFDGEDEFVVTYSGYNRDYYACFDLIKGNQLKMHRDVLQPISEPPYNNIVGGGSGHNYTEFDYKNKKIHIFESLGCCAYQETWAEYQQGDGTESDSGVKVVKSEHHEFQSEDDGSVEIIEIYNMVGDTLKLVNKKRIPF